MSSPIGNIGSKTIEVELINEFGIFPSIFISVDLRSERIQRSLSEETETIGDNTGRENRLTPPHSPTTTFGRNHESYPFFLRCHRHYHPRQHHRSGNRSRRIEV